MAGARFSLILAAGCMFFSTLSAYAESARIEDPYKDLVPSGSETDGVKCLYLVMKVHGRNVTMDELMRRVPVKDGAASLLSLKRCAEEFGFRCEGYRPSYDELLSLPMPLIAITKQNHFVLLFRADSYTVELASPERVLGMSREAFLQKWEGSVLSCIPDPRGETSAEKLPQEVAESHAPKQGLYFENPVWELGTMTARPELEHTFKLTNASDRVVKILDTESSCSCAVMENLPNEIAPGEEVEVRLRIQTSGRRGVQKWSVTVTTDCEKSKKVGVEATADLMVPEGK